MSLPWAEWKERYLPELCRDARKHHEERRRRAAMLRRGGWTLAQIGTELGISAERVRQILAGD